MSLIGKDSRSRRNGRERVLLGYFVTGFGRVGQKVDDWCGHGRDTP